MLKQALRACREHFLLAAALSALVNILYLSPTIYMMQVYDRVVPTNGLGTLVWITVIVTLALGTLAALDALRSRVLLRSTLRLEALLAGTLLDRLIGRRSAAMDARTLQAMREFDTVRQALGGPAAAVVFDIPWIPIYLIVAFLLHPLLALLILIGGAVLIGVTLLNEATTRARNREAHAATAEAYAAQEGVVARAETVRALGMRRAMVARQLNFRARGLNLLASAQIAGSRYSAAAKFIRMLLQSLALGLAAALAVERQVSVGAIIAASVLLSRALQPIEQLVGSWPTISQARSAFRTVFALLGEADEAPPRTRLPEPQGAVACEAVALAAGPQGPVLLQNISFSIPAGTVLGIVGPSGAGKTGLARIIAGAIAPDHGYVRYDGANIADWDPEELAARVGYLPQDYALLPGTIAENIARFSLALGGERDEVDARVVDAATRAGAHAMILRLPEAYETRLDIAGNGLSAGQKQRIALARALYGDPPILILDEPEAALDAESEMALQAAIRSRRERGGSVILVSHRSAIVGLADMLLVLREGRVVSFGEAGEVLGRAQPAGARVIGMKGGQA